MYTEPTLAHLVEHLTVVVKRCHQRVAGSIPASRNLFYASIV
jgi:hypothetical protein